MPGTFVDAVQMMIAGETAYAVIPQENTIGGPVYSYVDELLAHNNIELVSLHDRPELTVLGNYVYLIECANTGYAGFEKLAVIDGLEFRYYGSFPVK